MKHFFKSKGFKTLCIFAVAMLAGMIIAAANGTGKSAQSTVVGTLFSPVQKAASAVANKMDSAFGSISGRKSYEDKIDSLQNEIGDLQEKLTDYENTKRQNELYKEFLELKEEKKEYVFEECNVIARESTNLFYSFTLDKGTANGIKVNDSVIYGKYLVGVVVKAYPDYSVVRTVLDSDFNAGVYEIVSKEEGYISGTLDLAKNGNTKLKSLSQDTAVTEGSVICTSGIGGVFPKDLIIGTVTEVAGEQTDISSYAVIKPGVDVRDLSGVFVITSTQGGSENE